MAQEPASLAVIPPEEHDRAAVIGGSDIGAILGINPHRTAVECWQAKTSPQVETTRDANRAPLRRGRRFEPIARDILVDTLREQGHDVEVLSVNRRYRDEAHSFFAFEVDCELRIDGAAEPVNVEIKTSGDWGSREWGASGSDELPLHYHAQIMWGLGVTRRSNALCGALIGLDDFRIYPVQADPETITGLRIAALAFWQEHVLTRIPPDARTLSDLATLYPHERATHPLIADDDLAERVLRLRAVKDEIRARESEADAIEFVIKRAMADAGELVLPNGKSAIDWKVRSGVYLDQAALAEAHPRLVREFSHKRETRVFRVKAFDTKGLQ